MTDQNQQASEAVEVKDCPFCGVKPELVMNPGSDRAGTLTHHCDQIQIDLFSTHILDRLETWNTRAVTTLTPKCDAEAVERIVRDKSFRLMWNRTYQEYRVNVPNIDSCDVIKVDDALPAITAALQSRDAENARLRELLKDANDKSLPRLEEIQLIYKVTSLESENARLNERVRELEHFLSEQRIIVENTGPDFRKFWEACVNKPTYWQEAWELSEADRDRLSAELARVKKAGSKMEAALQRTLDVYPIMAMKAGVKGDIEDALKEYRNWKENSNMLTPEQREEME